jgi:hypothetical protein
MGMKAVLGILGTAAMMMGCATVDGDYWSRPGLSQETLDKEARACVGDALEAGEIAPAFGKTLAKRDEFVTCMTAKGLMLRKFTGRQTSQMYDMNPAEKKEFVEALMAEAILGRGVIFIPADRSSDQERFLLSARTDSE